MATKKYGCGYHYWMIRKRDQINISRQKLDAIAGIKLSLPNQSTVRFGEHSCKWIATKIIFPPSCVPGEKHDQLSLTMAAASGIVHKLRSAWEWEETGFNLMETMV